MSRIRVPLHFGRCRTAVACAAVFAATGAAGAQAPGLPLLQGPFVRAGVAVGANAARDNGRSAWGGAVAWAPGSQRFLVTAGGAALDAPAGLRSPATTLGGRLALPVVRGGRVGVAAFGGYGRARFSPDDGTAGAGGTGMRQTSTQLAVGATAGVRGAFGGTRAWALSVAPFYARHELAVGDATLSRGLVRASAAAEVALAARIGVQAGVEAGQRADREEAGPRGTLVGVGLSYAFGARRR